MVMLILTIIILVDNLTQVDVGRMQNLHSNANFLFSHTTNGNITDFLHRPFIFVFIYMATRMLGAIAVFNIRSSLFTCTKTLYLAKITQNPYLTEDFSTKTFSRGLAKELKQALEGLIEKE